VWTIPDYLYDVMFWRLLCSHGTVSSLLFMPVYKYSHAHILINLTQKSVAHRELCVCCYVVRIRVSFCCKFSHDILKEIQSTDVYVHVCMSGCVFLSVETNQLGYKVLIWSLSCKSHIHYNHLWMRQYQEFSSSELKMQHGLNVLQKFIFAEFFN
jgi:hypothetical protein